MTSPSTLIRRAQKAKNPAVAKRLRAAAAKMRREIRGNRKPKRARKSLKRRLAEAAASALVMQYSQNGGCQAAVAEANDEGASRPVTEKAIIEPAEIDRLRDLARSRTRPLDFEMAVRANLAGAKVRGRTEHADALKAADERWMAQVRTNAEAQAIQIVSSFMARVQTMEVAGRGLPPAFVLDGLTAARVYDALRDAGYTANGKDSGFRKRS